MKRLVIADDNLVSTMELEEYLGRKGYQVAGVAASGIEAIKMAKSLVPELILMELDMPGEMSGVAAAEKIKSEMGIPAVFLVGHAPPTLLERAKKVWPYGFVRKPFQAKQVEALIEVALQDQKRMGSS